MPSFICDMATGACGAALTGKQVRVGIRTKARRRRERVLRYWPDGPRRECGRAQLATRLTAPGHPGFVGQVTQVINRVAYQGLDDLIGTDAAEPQRRSIGIR